MPKMSHCGPQIWILLSCLIIVETSSTREYNGCRNVNHFKAGDAGVVPCDFINFSIVTWTIETEDVPVIYVQNAQKRGPGYLSGEYDILKDGSLVIRRVSPKPSQHYTARVNSNGDMHAYMVQVIAFVPSTSTRVPATPQTTTSEPSSTDHITDDVVSSPPLSVIDGCYSSPNNCSLNVGRNGTLTCSAKNTADEYVKRMECNLHNCTDILSFHRVDHALHRDTANGCHLTVSEVHFTVKTDLMSKCPVSCTAFWSDGNIFTSTASLTTANETPRGECDSSERDANRMTSSVTVLTSENDPADQKYDSSERGEERTTTSVTAMTSENNPPDQTYDFCPTAMDVASIVLNIMMIVLIAIAVIWICCRIWKKSGASDGERHRAQEACVQCRAVQMAEYIDRDDDDTNL